MPKKPFHALHYEQGLATLARGNTFNYVQSVANAKA